MHFFIYLQISGEKKLIKTLDGIARKYGTDKRTNDEGQNIYHGYTPIYEQLFEPTRNTCQFVLELGVREGWSHQMWVDYFPNAMIYGIDNFSDITYKDNPSLIHNVYHLDLSNPRIKFFQCSQDDEAKINMFFQDTMFDIIIDDGSHRSWHQQRSFKYLFPRVKSGGYYIIEDLGVCGIREFREFDDRRSSTIHWLMSMKVRDPFSYYMDKKELKNFLSEIESVDIIGELGIIKKK